MAHTLRLSTESLLVSCTPPEAPTLPNSGGKHGRPLPVSLKERPKFCCGMEGTLSASSLLGTEVVESLEGRADTSAVDCLTDSACVWLENGLFVASMCSPPSVMVCKLGEEPLRGREGAGPG